MKIKSIICVLFIFCSLSASFAKRSGRAHFYNFGGIHKSLPIPSLYEAVIEDNAIQLNLSFGQNLGNAAIHVTDASGQTVHTQMVDIREGDTYTIYSMDGFKEDMAYYVTVINGEQSILIEFPVEL
ncbi:MAG: DUF3244 domain-containing protein [Tannerellaceae bacterium]|nr:DUF3244 domain-containing protein [Tannerellaceae bacterium]